MFEICFDCPSPICLALFGLVLPDLLVALEAPQPIDLLLIDVRHPGRWVNKPKKGGLVGLCGVGGNGVGGWLASWLVGWLVGWSGLWVGWLGGWLVCVGWVLVVWAISFS